MTNLNQNDKSLKKIVLASQSINRINLLKQLQIPFIAQASNIDETPFDNETPNELVKRLARQKAEVQINNFSDAIIIGSDQVGILYDKPIGKPLNYSNTVSMLLSCSEKTIEFVTGVCIIDAKTNKTYEFSDSFYSTYKKLDETIISKYLAKEQPFECAGGLKVEGLGISLLDKLEGDDPTCLIGLPLIKLTKALNTLGIDILDF